MKKLPFIDIINANTWWAAAHLHWENIKECAQMTHHPDLIKKIPEAEEMLKIKDVKLLHFINSIWIAAPDKSYIHEWPSWGQLCDLCSEGEYLDTPERRNILDRRITQIHALVYETERRKAQRRKE